VTNAQPDDASLVERLTRRDPTAPADLAEIYLQDINSALARRHPEVDSSIPTTAAIDAILDFAEHPERFDPSRSSLRRYLLMAGEGDLRNALRAEARHRKRRAPVDVVEQAAATGNIEETALGAGDPVGDEVVTRIVAHEARRRLAELTPSKVERAAMELLITGERRTDPYAELLGIAHLPAVERRRQVKRLKDRLTKRLQRSKGELSHGD
jgi:RNA polymerase sigma-70 factor (ECF subfamily)